MSDITHTSKKSYRPVAIWLYIGVFMLVIQIVLGGITRLTESGLSITEWDPITGVMPPMNQQQWQQEFDKYKTTSQFQYIHSDFSLSDFKGIFFWEWLHRNWARLMGLVFLVGFVYFLVKKKFSKPMILPMAMLFVLGAIQGAIGWIMVASGLVPQRLFVGHVQLATHFIAALILLSYTFWFALSLSVPKTKMLVNIGLKHSGLLIVVLLFFQLIFGAFMAGTHAAVAAPTWPTINGQWIPTNMNTISPSWENLINNKITIQFVHRLLAYTLFVLIIFWWVFAMRKKDNPLFSKARWYPFFLVILQVILGILTVVLSPIGHYIVYFGVIHQLVAILLLLSIIFILFIVKQKKIPRVTLLDS